MKKIVGIFVLSVCLIPFSASAQRGCCSHHGGVAGCSDGRQVCNDGTLSPSCTCSSPSSTRTVQSQPTYVYGCTNSSAINYNYNATKDDGSCVTKVLGCMDSAAINYNSAANVSDDLCKYKKSITLSEKIEKKVEYEYSDKLSKNTQEVVKKGSDGKKDVVYDAVVDKDGNILSKEKISENIVTQPVAEVIREGTEESSGAFAFIWVIALISSFVYAFSHKEGNLLLNKISRLQSPLRMLLYVLYVIFIVPCFIDLFLLVINLFNKKTVS